MRLVSRLTFPFFSAFVLCARLLSVAEPAPTSSATSSPAAPTPSPAPVRALLVTGGCCHNYPLQTQAIKESVAETKSLAVEWTVVNEGGTGTRAEISLYEKADWADAYDIVVHNACFADTANIGYIRRITAAHRRGKPALVIHCAMHSYRAAKEDDWREFLGVTSRRHDHQARYPVAVVQPGHPVMKNFPANWVTPKDELYTLEKIRPGVTALATAVSEVDGSVHPVVWVNDYHGARVFGTTFGHSDETFLDPVFRDLLARGFAWALGHTTAAK